MKLFGLFSTLVLGFATLQSATATASTTIEGYAQPCSLILGSDVTTVKIEIFATSAEAVESQKRVMAPLHTAFVDGGAGYILMNIDKSSQARRMCQLVKANGGADKVTLVLNDNKTIEQLTIGSETVISDAFFLKDERTREQMGTLGKALIQVKNLLDEATEKAKPTAAADEPQKRDIQE